MKVENGKKKILAKSLIGVWGPSEISIMRMMLSKFRGNIITENEATVKKYPWMLNSGKAELKVLDKFQKALNRFQKIQYTDGGDD